MWSNVIIVLPIKPNPFHEELFFCAARIPIALDTAAGSASYVDGGGARNGAGADPTDGAGGSAGGGG